MFELMLPAHVRPEKGWSRAAMNGSKDNTIMLQWLFRGLHSVLGTQLDHPFGPEVALQTLAHTHTHTHWVWLIQHGDPLLSALHQLCLHGSSGNSICCCHFGDTLKEVSQQTPNAHPGPLTSCSNNMGPLIHKMNRWCKSWILKTKESITVCFKTVRSSENWAFWLWIQGGKCFWFYFKRKAFISYAFGNLHPHTDCPGDLLVLPPV